MSLDSNKKVCPSDATDPSDPSKVSFRCKDPSDQVNVSFRNKWKVSFRYIRSFRSVTCPSDTNEKYPSDTVTWSFRSKNISDVHVSVFISCILCVLCVNLKTERKTLSD